MDKLLNVDDHHDVVTQYLSGLSQDGVIAVGEALGLNPANMKKMTDMPGDMVDAWIVMKDNVFGKSGEATWTSLVKALKEVKQTTLAAQIKKDIEGGGPPKVTKSEPVKPSSRVAVTSSDDVGEGKVQEDRIDDPPPTDPTDDRIEDDFNWPLGGKNKVHRQAMDRGEYKAQLKLHDSNDDITEITPETSSQQPFSRRGFYSMKSKRHGVALIINNKEFRSSDHRTRRGTDRDEENLAETWLFLGYHVTILRNCTRDEMARTFEKIDKLLKNVKDIANDSFVCCILSHGREGEVFGSDSRPLEHTWIQRFLARSEILRSRPKLLFIQACQGSSPGGEVLKDRLKEIGTDDDTISEYTDFYLSCASVHGDRSYRDIYTGTWFISELCQTLCERGMVMDLDEIQKEVNERVVQKYEHLGYKQQPRGIDQLRRKVFFFQQ